MGAVRFAIVGLALGLALELAVDTWQIALLPALTAGLVAATGASGPSAIAMRVAGFAAVSTVVLVSLGFLASGRPWLAALLMAGVAVFTSAGFGAGPVGGAVGMLGTLAYVLALVISTATSARESATLAEVVVRVSAAAAVGWVVVAVGSRWRERGAPAPSPALALGWIDIRDGGFEVVAGLLVMVLYASYLTTRKPALRGPLGAALFAGVLTWGLTSGALSLIENQASRPPRTELYTLDGAATNLASLQQSEGNRPMVVNLWATWCPPCRAEMPVLEQAQKEHSDILFVFVNQAEAAPTIQKFINQMKLDVDHVLRDRRAEVGRQAGSAALPTTLFYDANGRLVDSHLGQLSKATLGRALKRFNLTADDSAHLKDSP